MFELLWCFVLKRLAVFVLLRNIIEENPARGYAFAVHYKGELVADLYGGHLIFLLLPHQLHKIWKISSSAIA